MGVSNCASNRDGPSHRGTSVGDNGSGVSTTTKVVVAKLRASSRWLLQLVTATLLRARVRGGGTRPMQQDGARRYRVLGLGLGYL